MDILADKYVMSLYYSLEDEVIADIARRVKKTGRYTETAELMAKSMREQGYSTTKIQSEVMKRLRADKELQKQIAENTKAYKQEIQNIIDATMKEAKENGNELIAEAANMSWNNDLSMWQQQGVDLKKPNTMSQLMLAFRKQTIDELRNLTRSTGFKNTVLGTTGIMNMYQREMDLALLKVSTGTFSYDQAVNDCVHRLAQSGLRSIDYANGRTYQLDTAVRMSVRTAMSQLSGKIMEENLKSTGQDLVITSQHMGSRPEHAVWQNKVFSFSGKSKKYPSLVEGTGYGTAGGLKGVNCTHDFYPFWEGISVIEPDVKEPDPVTINGKEYTYFEATQKQRYMERNIRATKREIEAQRAIGGDTAELQSKLRKQTVEYRRFSADAGLRAKENRLRVISGSSSASKRDNKIDLGHLKGVRLEKVVEKTNIDSDDIDKIKNTISMLSEEYSFKIDALEIGNYTDEEHLHVPLFHRVTDDDGPLMHKIVINNACDFWSDKDYQQLFFESGYFAGNCVEDFTMHEVAHLLTYQGCESMIEVEILAATLKPLYTNGVSQYCWTEKNGAETIAEAFVRERKGKKINDDARKLLGQYIEVWRR